MSKSIYEINMDLDVEGILAKIDAASDFIQEYLAADFEKTKEELLSEAKAILSTNRTAMPFHLGYSNTKMHDLSLKVDPKRKRITAKSPRFKRKRAAINGVLRIL
jgi:hypothetical protein